MTNQKVNRFGKALTAGVSLAIVAGMTTASADTTQNTNQKQEVENSTASYKNSAAHDYATALIKLKAENNESIADETKTQDIQEKLNDDTREPVVIEQEVQEQKTEEVQSEQQQTPVEVVTEEAPVVDETPETETAVEETEAQEIEKETLEENQQERAVSIVKTEPEYNSTITIVTPDEKKTVDVADESQTLEEVLEENIENSPSTYRDDNNKVLDKDTLGNALENESSITVYPTHRDVTTEEVSIPFQTEEKETDELYEGETEVEQEGIEGTGVKVTERVTNAHEENSQQSLKIVNAPQKEIILVGTKPEPEPEPEPVVEEPETPVVEPDEVEPANSSSTPPAPAPGRTQGSTVGTGDSSNDTSKTNNAVVDLALEQAGKPYVWGGTSQSGFDCSGLVYWANAQNGKSVPRTARAQGAASKSVSWDDIQVGDIVYTNTHIGFYAGNDRVVHAANPSRGVVIDSASSFKQRGFKVGRL